ncbi:hypothetical protein SUGI_1057020 [Cryptomeria japonica]|nr:hypothetical protein SUGI_1057020 [Cryptomeria japonica]
MLFHLKEFNRSVGAKEQIKSPRKMTREGMALEKQSLLSALADEDIVLGNIWFHDDGGELAANKPLLRAVFWVMMYKMTLPLIIRDKTKTPHEAEFSTKKAVLLYQYFVNSNTLDGLSDRRTVVPAFVFPFNIQLI